MADQPEAIRWACLLEREAAHHGATDYKHKAAAELRRLRAVNAELLEALKFYGSSCDATESTPCGYEGNLCCKRARAAIARVEGELNERP
jgi:hypothetical protein